MTLNIYPNYDPAYTINSQLEQPFDQVKES